MRAAAPFRITFHPSTNSFYFLTNATYRHYSPARMFVPQSGQFERPSRFPVPQWFVGLKTRFRFILLDPEANRIIDYVNLDTADPPVDLTEAKTQDGRCGATYDPDGALGSMWCTNRPRGATSEDVPTFGILNQIGVGAGTITRNVVWENFRQETVPGVNRQGAINFFRTNLAGLTPIPGTFVGPLYLTNRFYAPFAPTRNISAAR